MTLRSAPIRLRLTALLVLLLAFGLFATACTDDATDTTAETIDGSEVTEVTEPESDEPTETVQTLDEAAPAEAQEPVEDETALLAPGLALNADGLDILDPDATTTELLAFGDDQAGVMAGLEAVLGSPDEMNDGTSECPNGQAAVATWTDTIMVDFDADGRFLSWLLLPGSDLTTIDDVGVGSPVSALDGVEFFEESTLGDEFNAGGYGGLATGTGPDATIDRLWAGDVCSFR